MSRALGLIETRGLVAAIEAADAMVKTANVTIIGKEITRPALVTIKISGDVAAVKAAVEAGAAAASKVGEVVSVHVIPSPDDQLLSILPEISDEPIPEASDEVLPDVSDETLSEISDEPEADNSEIDEKDSLEDEGKGDLINGSILEEQVVPLPAPEDLESADTPTNIINEPHFPSEAIITPGIAEKVELPEKIKLPEPEEIKQKPVKPKKERLPKKENKNSDEQSVSSVNSFSLGLFDGNNNDTISRLRKEALGIKETKEIKDKETETVISDKPVFILPDNVDSLNVHQLRHLARGIQEFPIRGREISKANRQELLSLFKTL